MGGRVFEKRIEITVPQSAFEYNGFIVPFTLLPDEVYIALADNTKGYTNVASGCLTNFFNSERLNANNAVANGSYYSLIGNVDNTDYLTNYYGLKVVKLLFTF